MKRLIALLCIAALLLPACALGELTKNEYLDAAFQALEEGNPFLTRYNETTGSAVAPLYPTGIPYFFAAKDARYLFMVRKVTQVSKYGIVGDKYIWGFDCSGYTNWIQDQVGDRKHPGLSSMILERSKYKDYRMDDLKGMDPAEISSHLQFGDFLAAKHGGRHILMYIGTLRDYGYDAESAPELQNYLDYPLMINCGNDPNYIARTQAYIDANSLTAKASKGGVTVSIVGMKETDAPHLREDGAKPFYYYQLGDYQLSVFDLPSATSFVWWRTIEKDRGVKKQ
jgi:hypothetical protein